MVLEEDPTINQAQKLAPNMVEVKQVQQGEPHTVEQLIPKERESSRIVMVNWNKGADKVIHLVQQDQVVGENNLAAMVERIFAQNGVNIGLHRPHNKV